MEAHHLLSEAAPTPARAKRSRALTAQAVARRLFDITVATAALLLFAPIILLAGLAVLASSPGPVLFRQRRLGRDRTPFTVLKFRTMWAGADSGPHREYVQTLLEGSAPEPDGGLYKLAVDSRVTRVGRFLRSWSLDELPQLINVLRGEMSLVGPRPVIPYEAELYPDDYLPRFAVKPGLTGLWQVSGRNERTYEEMVRFDVEYAERKSLGLDALILLKTVWVVLRRKGVA